MKTPMLKRRLNPFLLASTVLVLSLLAGLAVVFQGRLSEVVSEKKTLKDTLNDKKSTIDSLRAERKNLTEEVATLSTSLENLKRQNQNLENEVSSKESTIQSKDKRISNLETDIQDKDKTIKDLKENISDILDDFKAICDIDDEDNLTENNVKTCHDYFGEDTP